MKKKTGFGVKLCSWRKKGTALVFALALSAWSAGCGTVESDWAADSAGFSEQGTDGLYGNKSEVDSSAYRTEEAEYESNSFSGAGGESGDSVMEPVPAGGGADIPLDGRKLISTVNLEVETKEFRESMSLLETRIQEMGGYVENMNTYNGSSYSGAGSAGYADLTIRMPRAVLKDFLAGLSGIGSVVRRSENVEDVTLAYVDVQSRRDTLRTEQSRLLEFLDRAESIEEIIIIEERLSDVRYELESMESRLRVMDNRVDYATVNLELSEVKELSPVEEQTFIQRSREGFMDTLREIREGAEDFFVWVLANVPYFAIWAVLLGTAFVLLRLRRRKKLRPGTAGGNRSDAGKDEQENPLQ